MTQPPFGYWTSPMFAPPIGGSNPEFITLGHETPQADLDVLVGLTKPWVDFHSPVVVEIGCWTGMSTKALAGANCVVHSIDHFQGNPDDRLGKLADEHGSAEIIRAFCHNLKPWLFRTVHLHIGPSTFYATFWPFQVDMVFIDGDHRYGCVKNDINAWWPHVKHGGVICGHDYPNFEGVRRAVEEFWYDAVGEKLEGSVGAKSNIWWRKKEKAHA